MWDWYGAYSTDAQTNPAGSVSGNYKVVRGGGWNDFPKHIRSAYRSAFPADVPLYSIGVRPVRNAVSGQGTLTSTSNTNVNAGTNKTLLVYFSQTNNTKGLAEIIAQMRDIDVFRIERKTPYAGTVNGAVLYAEALTEQRENAIPDLKVYLEDEGLNIDDYNTILLGYCNWWASIPAPVRSFLNRYDLSEKTIIPFCSMGGGHFGQTISAVAKLAPNSTIKKGLEVAYASYNHNEIENWLTENGIGDNDRNNGTGEENSVSGKKSIVVYFSASADNTKRLAETMASVSDSDIARIVPETAYTAADLNYNNPSSRANMEVNSDARPAILPMSENFEQYDTIILGYPIWHGQTPPAVRTFLDTYEDSLAGRKIIPFCTSGSTGISGSVLKIRELCPNSTVANGFRGTANMSAEDVMQQLKQNGFEEKEKMLKIKVENRTMTAALVENSSTAALKDLLAKGEITIHMSDYGNFEKVGSLGAVLPRNDEQITTEAGDLILYQGNSFAIYYDTNSWNFTRLGKINDITQAELKSILGNGNVTVTLSME